MRDKSWKLQDAKARFSEVVRRAMAGEPQHVTVHGKEAVAVIDTSRFDAVPKPARGQTLRGFVEASKPYRGILEGVDLSRHGGMTFSGKRLDIFDDNSSDEKPN